MKETEPLSKLKQIVYEAHLLSAFQNRSHEHGRGTINKGKPLGKTPPVDYKLMHFWQ